LKLKIFFKNCPYNFAVVNVGKPVCGVNAAIHSFCREGISKGCKIFAIYEGFQGLVNGNVINISYFFYTIFGLNKFSLKIRELEWANVYGWNNIGGSLIGCQK
jgi:6-phosphofructokinase 1